MSTNNDPTAYGVQDDGSFRRKHVDEINGDLQRRFRNAVGSDVELRQASAEKQMIDAISVELSRQWMALEETYYAGFFADASGEALDKILALPGFSRRPIQSATGEVRFSRSDPAPEDIRIPAGTVVTTDRTETRPQIPFETTEPVILNQGDTQVTATIEGLKPWQTDLDESWLGEETNLAAGEISRTDDPIAGIGEVTNPTATGDPDQGYQIGRDRETDPELRLRYQNELGADGYATVDNIRASVLNADERIEAAFVDEVHDTTNNEYGVTVTVSASQVSDTIVAEAIFDAVAAGLDTYGSTTVQLDYEGDTFDVSFDRATQTAIVIEADVQTNDNFTVEAESQLKDELVEYVGGTDTEGELLRGLSVGEDVVWTQVVKRVVGATGVEDATVKMAISGNTLDQDNVAIGSSEVALLDATDITITEV